MKKSKEIKIAVSNANPGQLLSIRAELNLMAKMWKSYGPHIEVKGRKLKEPKPQERKSIRLW